MLCQGCKKPLKINQAELDRGYINKARLYCDAICGIKAARDKQKASLKSEKQKRIGGK